MPTSPASSGFAAPPAAGRAGLSDRWFSVLLITPAMLITLIFAILPLVQALDVTFRMGDLSRGRIGDYVGLENYRVVFADAAFWQAGWVTVKFTR